MRYEPPQDGKFKTADGYGGTFTDEGALVDGRFQNNFELCPKLNSLNSKGISLCSPFGRWITCDDPRWNDATPRHRRLQMKKLSSGRDRPKKKPKRRIN